MYKNNFVRSFAVNISFILVTAFMFLFPSMVNAVNCSNAASSTEKTICADPLLMQLDAVLNENYFTYVAKQGQDLTMQSQEDWLRKERDVCADAVCLEAVYKKRIQELIRAEEVFIIQNAAPEWDVIISILACDKNEKGKGVCQGPAVVDIFARGSGILFQRINMPMYYAQTNGILVENDNTTAKSLVMDDFNFDGYNDLALRNGNTGAYNSPSYDIYLYDPSKKQFIHSEAFTELASHNIGLFVVDPKAKTIKTFNKIDYSKVGRSELGYRYIWTKYQIKGNMPIQMMGGSQAWRPRDMPPGKYKSIHIEKDSILIYIPFLFFIAAIILIIPVYVHVKILNEYMLNKHKEKWEEMKGLIVKLGIERRLFILFSSENFGDRHINFIRKKIRKYTLYFVLSVLIVILSGLVILNLL